MGTRNSSNKPPLLEPVSNPFTDRTCIEFPPGRIYRAWRGGTALAVGGEEAMVGNPPMLVTAEKRGTRPATSTSSGSGGREGGDFHLTHNRRLEGGDAELQAPPP